MYVKPVDHIQAFIFWYGYYEKEAILTWEAMLQPGDIVLDIGANTGYYTLIAAPVASKVYAFEPATPARDLLQRNVQLNKLKNVDVLAIAASDHTGLSDLYLSGPDNTGMSGFQPAENFSGSIEFVNTVKIDEWISTQSIQQIDKVKIDVEGAELIVLDGMKQMLTAFRPVLFMEVMEHLLKQYDAGIKDVFQWMENAGYAAYEIVSPKQLSRLAEPKEAYSLVFLPFNYLLPAAITVKARSE